jgi:lactoylglutathione lyase
MRLLMTMIWVFAAIAAQPTAVAADSTEPAVFSNTIVWVPDVKSSATFYNSVFGIKTRFQIDLGTHWWLEMDTGTTHLSFASEKQAEGIMKGRLHRNRRADSPAAIALTFRVKDMQAVLARATRAGATIIEGPTLQSWGSMEARVRDPDGLLVTIIAPPTTRAK